MQTIGYLIHEFPGQTHIFIWRERCHLQPAALRPVLVPPRRRATRGPVDWAARGEAQASCLLARSAVALLRAPAEVGLPGARAWARCRAAPWRATGMTAGQRLRLLAMIPIA